MMDVSTGKIYEIQPGESIEDLAERLNLEHANMAEIYAEKQAVERLSQGIEHLNRAERRDAKRKARKHGR